MKQHFELRATEMRARSTEVQRIELWAKLERKFQERKVDEQRSVAGQA